MYCYYFGGGGSRVLVGFAVGRAAFAFAVWARAALWAAVAARVVPRLLRSFTVIAVKEKSQAAL